MDFAGEVGRSDLPDRDACHLLCGEWHVIHAGLLAHQGLHGNDFLVKICDHRCRARADDRAEGRRPVAGCAAFVHLMIAVKFESDLKRVACSANRIDFASLMRRMQENPKLAKIRR